MDDWKDNVVNYFPRILDFFIQCFLCPVAISMFRLRLIQTRYNLRVVRLPVPLPIFPTIDFSGICTKQVHFAVHDVLIEGIHSVLVACSCCIGLLVGFDLRLELV